MPYATITDLQARMPQFPLTPTSKPSVSEAAIFLADVEGDFEGQAANAGFIVPVTGAQSLRIAREAVILGAIARILYARGAGVGGDAAMQSADKYQKRYDDYLKALWDPLSKLEMTDCPRTGSQRAKPQRLVSSLWTVERWQCGNPRSTMDDPW